MILPSQDSKDGANSSAGPSQPPPSYVQEDRHIDPIDKTPAFPSPEDHRPAFSDFSTNTSNLSYYASLSPSTSGSTSPRLGVPPEASPRPSFQSSEAVPSPFSRAPPPELSYPAFKPIFLVAQGKTLDKGFPPAPPPSDTKPHPFISHDVSEADWVGFLNATRAAASLTEKDLRRSYLPIISMVPIVNDLAAVGVQKIMKSKKGDKVAKTIDIWNHHFFGPRRLRVILMKGQAKLSGLTELPADGHIISTPSNLAPITADDDVYRLFVVSI